MDAEPKFEVRDRRLRFDEPPPDKSSATGKSATGAAENAGRVPLHAGPGAPSESLGAQDLFSGLALSIAASGLTALGEPSHGGAAPPDLAAAQQTIDLLGVLEQKTRGNLTGDEARLLSELLYTLRVKFVDVARAQR